MKTIFHLCIIAIFSFAAVACKKSALPEPIAAIPGYNEPGITSKINRFIMEPVSMQLGTEYSVIHKGDKVTILVPYTNVNENITSATITMTDDATGLPVGTYDLIPSTDESASLLTLPKNMTYQKDFYYVSFEASEEYFGKKISITTTLVGENMTSTDVLSAAFTVEP